MNKTAKRAFSLPEVLITVFLLSTAILAFTVILQSSGKQLELTGNVFIANHLSAKILADLGEDSRLNGTLLEFVTRFPDLLSKGRVVDGESAYFRLIRDRKPRWGVLDPVNDGGITKDDSDLYQELKPFSVQVNVERPSGLGSHLAQAKVKATWREKGGKQRDYDVAALFVSPEGAKPFDQPALVAPSLIPSLGRRMLFPEKTGMTFAEAVTDSGGDQDVLLAFAKVGVITRQLQREISSLSAQITMLTKKRAPMLAKPSLDLLTVQLRLCDYLETGASLNYLVMSSLDADAKVLLEQFAPEKLGSCDPLICRNILWDYQTQVKAIPFWIQRAGNEFAWLLNPALAKVRSYRTEEFVRLKTLEAYRLLAAIDLTRKPLYASFVTAEARRLQGKNPFWSRLFAREKDFTTSIPKLLKAFPTLQNHVSHYTTTLKPTSAKFRDLMTQLPR